MEAIPEIAGSGMPIWVDMAIAIITALGGVELVKYFFSLRSNRRKDKAQAAQEETVAAQGDTDWRQKELELMTQFVATAKMQYEDLSTQYSALKQEKEEDRKIKADLRYRVSELERKTLGLQRAFAVEVTKKRFAEDNFCRIDPCPLREPPKGTFKTEDTQDTDMDTNIIPVERKRDDKGRFIKMYTADGEF